MHMIIMTKDEEYIFTILATVFLFRVDFFPQLFQNSYIYQIYSVIKNDNNVLLVEILSSAKKKKWSGYFLDYMLIEK